MGKGFGELAYIRGLVKYSLSPFEQRAFAGMITKGIPNTFRRFAESGVKVLPPFIIGYLIYDQVEKEHDRLNRKNPQDFVNDK